MTDREYLIHQAADVLFPVVHPGAARVFAEDPGGTCSWDQSHRIYAEAVVDAGWLSPEGVAQAKKDALREARAVIGQYLATAEKWRYDRVMWAFAVMLGEIPEGSPEPMSPADHEELRRRRRYERPTICGLFTDDPDLSQRAKDIARGRDHDAIRDEAMARTLNDHAEALERKRS